MRKHICSILLYHVVRETFVQYINSISQCLANQLHEFKVRSGFKHIVFLRKYRGWCYSVYYLYGIQLASLGFFNRCEKKCIEFVYKLCRELRELNMCKYIFCITLLCFIFYMETLILKYIYIYISFSPCKHFLLVTFLFYFGLME